MQDSKNLIDLAHLHFMFSEQNKNNLYSFLASQSPGMANSFIHTESKEKLKFCGLSYFGNSFHML